jgi:hypothetical protein
MINRLIRFLHFLAIVVLVGCTLSTSPDQQETPLPGWRVLVSNLLLDDEAMPDGWSRIRDWPKGSLTDTSINHVYRSWWGEAEGIGKIEHAVWRAYSIDDAKDFYAELRHDQYDPLRTPSSSQIYIAYKTPTEIQYSSQVADEYYLACGWSGFPRCVAIARYRNYVSEIIADWETIGPDGELREGLTFDEIEELIKNMDEKFLEFLNSDLEPAR